MEAFAPEMAGDQGVPLRRMALAVLALAGVLISAYLLLYHLGYIGTVACGPSAGCETVQLSRWSSFLGVPVPLWGLLGYGAILATAVAGVAPDRTTDRRIAALLLVLAAAAFVFSIYLSALEQFVIRAWCRWCIGSAIVAALIFAGALPEGGALRGPRGEGKG